VTASDCCFSHAWQRRIQASEPHAHGHGMCLMSATPGHFRCALYRHCGRIEQGCAHISLYGIYK